MELGVECGGGGGGGGGWERVTGMWWVQLEMYTLS